MIVILHNVRSAFNVGAIFRTADACGIEKIYLSGITPGPFDRFGRPNTRLTKVALGAEKSVAFSHVSRTMPLVRELGTKGYTVIALEQSRRAIPYDDVSTPTFQNIALIVGNEVKGLPPNILRAMSCTIEIPMFGKKESLNVAVAFGIVAFALRL